MIITKDEEKKIRLELNRIRSLLKHQREMRIRYFNKYCKTLKKVHKNTWEFDGDDDILKFEDAFSNQYVKDLRS